jgi:hypothetical protein
MATRELVVPKSIPITFPMDVLRALLVLPPNTWGQLRRSFDNIGRHVDSLSQTYIFQLRKANRQKVAHELGRRG